MDGSKVKGDTGVVNLVCAGNVIPGCFANRMVVGAPEQMQWRVRELARSQSGSGCEQGWDCRFFLHAWKASRAFTKQG